MFLLFLSFSALAQNLFVTGKASIQPSFVIQENYLMIRLTENKIGEERCNFLNLSNPLTNLVLLNDEKGLSYHILYQTNFEGKLLYLACSRNLMALLERNRRLSRGMDQCIQRANQQLMSLTIVDEMIRCLLERVNH